MIHPVALITGGTRGIGLGIAKALAGESCTLALNGVRPETAVTHVLDMLRGRGVEVQYFPADISIAEERQLLVDAVIERFGRINILVNNAGRAPSDRRDILDATLQSFRDLLDTNLVGPYFLTQLVARHMLSRDSWSDAFAGFESAASAQYTIVFVTSVSAELASVNRGEYCVSKAGLSMAARLWAVRLAEYGIPVYEVRPGIIRTDMTAPVREKYDRLIADGLTLEPRWGTPDDVGRVVAALVRGDLPYATGSVLTIDGGLNVPRL